jgi:hypothetical protein
MIGDDSDMLAPKSRELLRFENIKPGLNTRRATGVLGFSMSRRCSRRQKYGKHSNLDKRGIRAPESSHWVPRYCNHTMIFWNALAAAALRA